MNYARVKIFGIYFRSTTTFTTTTVKPVLKNKCFAERLEQENEGGPWIPACDENGGYRPLQCYQNVRGKMPECWCVNEAGIRLTNTPSFPKGRKQCSKFIMIALTFKIKSPLLAQ